MAIENIDYFGKPSFWAMMTGLLKRSIILIPNAGAPTSGTSGTGVGKAGPGSLCFDYSNGQVYINTNTVASPTWAKLADSAGDISLAEGNILVGDASGLATALNAKTTTQILVGNGTTLTSVAVSADATLANTGALTLGAVVTGAKVANVANINVIGGIPVIFRITCAALTGDIDVVMTNKVRVIDARAIATAAGGAGDTITVGNGATPITNAMDLNVADNTLVRAASINDAAWDIAAAGTLRITGVSGATAEVVVEAIRVA